MEIPVGLQGQAQTLVSENSTAQAAGSGTLPVFATPAMLSLIEQAAWQSVAPYLEEGTSTVGTHFSVSHDAATPVGMCVRAETTVTSVQGRKITFQVAAFDEAGQIARGTHERFIVYDEKFISKTYRKLQNSSE